MCNIGFGNHPMVAALPYPPHTCEIIIDVFSFFFSDYCPLEFGTLLITRLLFHAIFWSLFSFTLEELFSIGGFTSFSSSHCKMLLSCSVGAKVDFSGCWVVDAWCQRCSHLCRGKDVTQVRWYLLWKYDTTHRSKLHVQNNYVKNVRPVDLLHPAGMVIIICNRMDMTLTAGCLHQSLDWSELPRVNQAICLEKKAQIKN